MRMTPLLCILALLIIGAANVHAQVDAARADISNLTSPNDDVRRKALVDLVLEIQTGKVPEEGGYTTFGDALLPELHRVILDLDDPHAKKACEAIWYFGTTAKMRADVNLLELDDAGRKEVIATLDLVRHYPTPSDYEPLKNALINLLIF